MTPNLDELLDMLDALTADAGNACATDMRSALALIRVRHAAVAALGRVTAELDAIAPDQLKRLTRIHHQGVELEGQVRQWRQKIREELSMSARYVSFAHRLVEVLDNRSVPLRIEY